MKPILMKVKDPVQDSSTGSDTEYALLTDLGVRKTAV